MLRWYCGILFAQTIVAMKMSGCTTLCISSTEVKVSTLIPELTKVVNAILGRDKRNSKARTVIDRARDRKSFGEVLTSFDSLKKTPGRMITASITVLSAYRKT